MRTINLRGTGFPGLDRARGYCIAFAVVVALAFGMAASTVYAGEYWNGNQGHERQMQEQQQAEQRNREAVQRWSQPTHPSWNQQQEQRLQDEKVHDYTLRQTTPSGDMTQKHCYTTGQTTTCF